jgi:hypothetical protein
MKSSVNNTSASEDSDDLFEAQIRIGINRVENKYIDLS